MVTQVTAHQVGSYFVQQYYHMFQQQRDYVHQFYNDSSSMTRVDSEINHSVTDLVNIHQLLLSLNFTAIEIKTINSLESWSGGVLVVVSGSVQSRDFNGQRRFVQTFFLAPQEKGYFVLNDMFHFTDEEVDHQSPPPATEEEPAVDYKPTISADLSNPPVVSNYALEEDAEEYGNSVNMEGDNSVQAYSYEDHHQNDAEREPEPELEAIPNPNRRDEEIPFEDPSSFHQNVATNTYQSQHSMEEPIGEPEKLTYASILRAKGKHAPYNSYQPTSTQSRVPAAEWNDLPQPLPQQSNTSLPSSGIDAVEVMFPSQEGESLSVYVRNLPSTITSLNILQEFEIFGKIKHDGVFLRNRTDAGVCYAFVEFEDIQSVRNALKASPIQLAGRNVYIEERRPNTLAARGGRNGGRGRAGRGGRTFGRGI